MRRTDRIASIIPADGWYAVYLLKEEPWYLLGRLCAWALVNHEDGFQEFAPIDGDGEMADRAEETTNFYICAHAGDITDEWRAGWVEEAQCRVRKQRVDADRAHAGEAT